MYKTAFILLSLFTGLLISCGSEKSPENKYESKTAEEGGYKYEYVTNDPTKTRIYTLDNGLKIYLSVYKDEPRVQVYMPVKAGGKNDPADNTGLAHYLEHMVFKGTSEMGTLDYEKEKPLLDSLENLFNIYAQLTSKEDRKAHYKLIDQVSNEAAKYAIPNEYDKIISAIGGTGSNAYTTEDRTVYITNIPSNQMERFLAIEGNRFTGIVNRLFHTELEAVYEEKNRALDSDARKAYRQLQTMLFEKHPYGTQSVLGTIDHLKNPSITEIKKYFDKYYRPNNMAICISGDIDPTNTVKLIDQYFGTLKPNENLEEFPTIEETPIEAHKTAEVFGPDAESFQMGFRFPGQSDPDMLMLDMVDLLLNNSEAGLIDLNLIQQQKVLSAGSYIDAMNDYAIHNLYGRPKEGQKLEEVRDMLLEQLELIKKGEFEDWLISAVVNDLKKSEMSRLESNAARANKMVTAFSNDIPWSEHISRLERMEKITKEQVVDFVKKNYGDNYASVYKRTGEDSSKLQIEKPLITKVPLNREENSSFYKTVMAKEISDIQPVFVEYNNDIQSTKTANGIEILSKENTENELFNLTFLLDIGSNNDPLSNVAFQYLEFLGTEKYSNEDLKKELYKLGCSMGISASQNKTYVTLSGLDTNMEAALVILEELLATPKPDQKALKDLVSRILQARENAKKNKGSILFRGLLNYARYGAESPFTNILSNGQLLQLSPEELIDKINGITTLEHRVLYYGPRAVGEVKEVLDAHHNTKEPLRPLPEIKKYEPLPTDVPKVYWTHYDMVQTEFVMYHLSEEYNKKLEAPSRVFNEYFGGALVFQEIREAQGLAYTAFSSYSTAAKADRNNQLIAYIGTQADKQADAMKAMSELLENMPESIQDFEVAKQGILSKIESERVTKGDVLWSYEAAKELELDYDIRKDVYRQVKEMTFDDLKGFHDQYIKDKSYFTVLVGDRENIDFDDLKEYGEVKELSLEEIFGYGKVESLEVELE